MRSLRLVAVVVLAATALAGPALAAEGEECGSDAVTVVVDAEMVGGELDARCVDVPAESPTMLAAVTEAGFDVEGTAEFGSSVVCRVDGAPDESSEPCEAMPSADAYWTSWVGADDGWAFAQEAVDAQEVAAGDVVALAFQEGAEERQPAVTPQEAVDAAEPAPAEGAAGDETGTPWVGIALGAAAVVLLGLLLAWVLLRRRTT
ncbi:hypothetical protein ACHAAC_07850 [Aeromicrobium sp. CF4.19]|uniref:hypothetical protein n=1 Tax=Aeromicrobium sp. CF4.19 TaxID=3373082 RepID=UPI003EE49368